MDGDSERWVAGGNKVWTHDKAFGYTEEEAEAGRVARLAEDR